MKEARQCSSSHCDPRPLLLYALRTEDGRTCVVLNAEFRRGGPIGCVQLGAYLRRLRPVASWHRGNPPALRPYKLDQRANDPIQLVT